MDQTAEDWDHLSVSLLWCCQAISCRSIWGCPPAKRASACQRPTPWNLKSQRISNHSRKGAQEEERRRRKEAEGSQFTSLLPVECECATGVQMQFCCSEIAHAFVLPLPLVSQALELSPLRVTENGVTWHEKEDEVQDVHATGYWMMCSKSPHGGISKTLRALKRIQRSKHWSLSFVTKEKNCLECKKRLEMIRLKVVMTRLKPIA